MKRKIAILAACTPSIELTTFIQGMQKAVVNENTDLYFFTCHRFVENTGYVNKTGYSIYNLINYEDFDGIILLAESIDDKDTLEKERIRIVQSGKPAVSINLRLDGMDFVGSDNYSGFYEIIEHMVTAHNIKDFTFLMSLSTSIDQDDKYKAFSTCLKNHNIDFDENRLVITSDNHYESGYEHGKTIFKDKEKLPEAIVCSNDWIALGILKAAEECGVRIPEDVKLVGFDDIDIAKCTIPSISTVDSKMANTGFEAVKMLLNDNYNNHDMCIKTTAILRQTCGCDVKFTMNQKKFSVNYVSNTKTALEFSSHMQHLEDVFLQSSDVYSLLTGIDNFFYKSHTIEGSDFCIFLKTDWTSILINSEEELSENLSFGNQVQSITNIQKNRKLAREIIDIHQLVPMNMINDSSNTYIFFPIFNHTYVHGYFVNKNNLAVLENFQGSNLTRSFGTNIERFRQKNMYKQMSQQFLKLSTKDALSGMLNRIGLEKLAKPFYAQNKKDNLTTFLLFADINSMKTINDKFGHLHGDLAVKTIADAILTVIPKNWMGIRYGGDEFLIVGNNKNYNNEDYLALIQKTILSKTSKMQLPYDLSASLGYYPVPPTSELTLEQAIEEVDKIMYAKKQEFHKTH